MQQSGYLNFSVSNKQLYDDLVKMGLQISGGPTGVFSRNMKIELPSGESIKCGTFDGSDSYFELLSPNQFHSVSAWVLYYLACSSAWVLKLLRDNGITLPAVDDDNYDELDEDDFEDYWAEHDLEDYSDELREHLESAFSSYDGGIDEAWIKYLYSFDEPGQIVFDIIHRGKREKISSDWCVSAFEEFELLPDFPVEQGVEAYLDERAEIFKEMGEEDDIEPEYQVWKAGRWEKVECKKSTFVTTVKMENASDYRIKNSVLKEYVGKGKDVEIPAGITSIGDEAFRGCKSLTSVAIPASVTSVGTFAFSDCSKLTSVVIPDGVTSIGDFAFLRCASLMGVMIPDSVTSIGSCAFQGCSSLSSVTIPTGVINIGDVAFRGCKALADEDGFVIVGNILFDYDGAGGDVKIPEGVIKISDYAFGGCRSLTSRTIPEGATSIGEGVFYECRKLKSITLPDSVTSIGKSAFDSCIRLTNVTIPKGVASIGHYAFSGCPKLTIHTAAGSYAEKYAKGNNISFAAD